MKFFELQEAPELKYAPNLENWYGKFDVRDISLENYYKLPERQLFTLKPSQKIIFTDIILFPFLLVSPKVAEVIRMYRERCFCRDVILLDYVGRRMGVEEEEDFGGVEDKKTLHICKVML